VFESASTLAVYVTDMARAKKFYTEVLKLEISADLGPELCFLKAKSGEFTVYLRAGHKPHTADSKTSRLGFFLRSKESAAETLVQLKAAGVKVLQDEPEQVADDTACFQFEDPDGNIIDVAGSL